MKLLVQSDDYGITKAVSLGIIEAIKFGIVRNTGLFANMPWTEEVVGLIKPFLNNIAFGVDLNISMIHVDFMIGTEDLHIEADTYDGNHVVIFDKGTWAI